MTGTVPHVCVSIELPDNAVRSVPEGLTGAVWVRSGVTPCFVRRSRSLIETEIYQVMCCQLCT